MADPRPIIRRYGAFWRSTPADLGFLLSSLPITLLGFIVIITGFTLGIGLSIIWIGLPVLVATVMAARWFGALELARLRFSGRSIVSARWTGGSGIRPVLTDPQSWSFLLHSGVVGLIIGLVTWTVAFSWVIVGLGGVTYALWGRLAERTVDTVWLHRFGPEALPWFSPASDLAELIRFETVFQAVLGIVFLITLPLVAKALVQVHVGVARVLLADSHR